MKSFRLISLFAAALGAAGSLFAQNAVTNGDFSSNGAAFSTFPGYLGGANPAAVDGWSSGPGGVGVNGVGIHAPFGPADKSAATYYCFLQGGGVTLTQNITLLPDTTYDLSFLAASRTGNINALGGVKVADNSTTYYDSTATHWDPTAFQAVSDMFTTGASFDGPVVLTLSNDSPGGDNTVSYSNLVISEFIAADPDGDGIETDDEISGVQNAFDGAPTDPNDPDSDGDGIDDKEEGQAGGGADGFVTDPNNADTDGDGYEDAFEITQGSDPTDAQSTPEVVVNGDFSSNASAFATFPGYLGGGNPGAIDGWTASPSPAGVNGVGIPTPFGPADQSAATYYGFLQNGGAILTQTIPLQPGTTYDLSFLAASRNGNAGALGRVLVSDNTTTYYDSTVTHWDPAAFQAVSDRFTTGASIDGPVVLTLSNDSGAGDNTVSYSDLSITEFVASDPDGDGISTADETSGVQNAFDGAPTDPNNADSDGDGIDDKEEGQAGGGADGFVTDPNSADTDGDGYADPFEIAQGSDPTDAQSTPNVVLNGDFSSEGAAFAAFPGYIGGANPAAIDAWASAPSGVGVNGIGISTPFGPADQSAATYYGFLQNGGATLVQTIPLLPNTTYDISFLASSRNGNAGALGRVLVADNTTTYYDSSFAHWDTAAFQGVSGIFTTGPAFDGPVVLTLSNDSPVGDNTVSYTNIVLRDFVDSDNDGLSDDWELRHFGNLDQDALADTNANGFSNLEDYAYGFDPAAAGGPGPLTIDQGIITNLGTPVTNVQNIPNGVDFSLLYTRLADYQTAGLVYTIEFSSDLATWFPSADPGTVIASSPGLEAVKVTFSFFLPNGRKARFWHIVITKE